MVFCREGFEFCKIIRIKTGQHQKMLTCLNFDKISQNPAAHRIRNPAFLPLEKGKQECNADAQIVADGVAKDAGQ